jgi:hypothetical protein
MYKKENPTHPTYVFATRNRTQVFFGAMMMLSVLLSLVD